MPKTVGRKTEGENGFMEWLNIQDPGKENCSNLVNRSSEGKGISWTVKHK